MEYITITCDMKKSSCLEDREAVQVQLIETLKEVNERFADAIACSFIITLGDEWQGLLHEGSDYDEIIEFIRRRMPGVPFYTGVGIGEVTIKNFELTVNQLDGPSFHKARKAVGIAKEMGYSLVLIK